MAEMKFLNTVGATVKINGVEQEKVTVAPGSTVEWEVSKEGYVTQSGSQEVTKDTVLPVELVRRTHTVTFNVSPTDATLTVNGTTYTPDSAGKVEITAKWGEELEWNASREGYATQSGTLTVTEDSVIPVALESETRTIYFMFNQRSGVYLTVNGESVEVDRLGGASVSAKDGDVLEWEASCEGYVTQSGTHTVNGDDIINVIFEVEQVTFTIVPTPSDAKVVINGEVTDSVMVDYGSTVEWEVSKDGYATQSGSQEVTKDTELPVSLEISWLTVSPSSITFSASGGSQTVEVDSSSAWKVTDCPSWCTVSPSSGSGG